MDPGRERSWGEGWRQLLSTWNGTVMFLGVGALALLSVTFYLLVSCRVWGLTGSPPIR